MTCVLLSRRALTFALLASFAACGGGDAPADSAAGADSAATSGMTPDASATVASNPNGEAIYASNCIACHQANGQGLPGAFPPLAGSEWATETVDRPIAILLHGMQGPVTVAGAEYNGVMMAGGAMGPMSDEQIADVLSYVRSSWGNTASAVTPADVARVRAATADRTTAWTAAELQAMP